MEPQWTKSISSAVVCDFFYFFFILYAIILVVSVVGVILALVNIKLPKSLLLVNGLTMGLGLTITTVQVLFFYLICDRALKPGIAEHAAKSIEEAFADKKKKKVHSMKD